MLATARLVRLQKRDTSALSLVRKANARRTEFPIKKLDDDEQLVFGEVYAPGFPDSQGDFMTPKEIKKMAYNFMRKSALSNIDTNHTQTPNGSYVVESFIAREGDPIYIPESWVLGVWVPDQEWSLVKSGELNGFSLDGFGQRVDTVFEIEMDPVLKGETDDGGVGHSHTFFVKFDEAGNFLGGSTSPGPNGHTHQIQRGTVTEKADGHAHRFSFVEGLLSAHAQV